MEFQLLLRG